MALREHRKEDIEAIEKRFHEIARVLSEIRSEMIDLDCESLDFQSESILNHHVVPLEDWAFRVKWYTEKQFRKLRKKKEAFESGQQYAAEKAQKSRKSPAKRKK